MAPLVMMTELTADEAESVLMAAVERLHGEAHLPDDADAALRVIREGLAVGGRLFADREFPL